MLRGEIINYKNKYRKANVIFDPDQSKIEKAKKKFSKSLDISEEILFIGKGFQLLVSDRFIYGSYKKRIPLEHIFVVSKSRFDLIQELSQRRGPRTDLLINGIPFVNAASGIMPIKFLIEVLERFGKIKRRRSNLHTTHIETISEEQKYMIASALVLSKRNREFSMSILKEVGFEMGYAYKMLEWMRQKYSKKSRSPGLIALIAGILVTSIPVLVALFIKKQGSSYILVLKGLGVFGVLLILGGLYKLITGDSGLNEIQLAKVWMNSQKK